MASTHDSSTTAAPTDGLGSKDSDHDDEDSQVRIEELFSQEENEKHQALPRLTHSLAAVFMCSRVGGAVTSA